jgi:hypothetical protein
VTTTDLKHPTSRSPIVRIGPLAVLLGFLVVVTAVFLRPIGDSDAWWHLRLGAELSQTWNLTDPPGWTRFATQSWVPTQWLPEVVASRMEAVLGLPALVWLMSATVIVLVVTLYVVCRREGGPLSAALATVLGLGGMSATLTPRPQLVSFILLVVVTGVWLQTARDLKPRWWLVGVSWVWACSHGMWFSGVLVGAVVTSGLMLDGRVRGRLALRLWAVPILSVVAAALTPVGPRLLLAPFAIGGVTGFITEWQAPSFRELAPALTAAMLVATLFVAGRRGRPFPWTRIGLLLLAAVWMLLSVRTVTLGAAIAAPLLSSSLDTLVSKQDGTVQDRAPDSRDDAAPHGVSRAEVLAIGATAVLCLLVAAVAAALVPALRAPANVPTALDSALDRLPAHTVVWNDFSLGGWLEWRHPALQPVVDGRAEAFGAEHLDLYGRVSSTRPGWTDTFDRLDIRVALVSTDSPLAAKLSVRPGWRIVGTDDGYVLLTDLTSLG